MASSRAVSRHLARIVAPACCAAVLALTQTVNAYAASRTVNFNFEHLWQTPEFKTGGDTISFRVARCNRPNKDMTVVLWNTDGWNQELDRAVIKCRPNASAKLGAGTKPGHFMFELGKLDDGKAFKGTATYSYRG
ncbi:hypothetical protein ACFV2Q_23120 [Streptomyces sp. NPDC059650]|uniref:hypothetical protein n=1 Tax=Streptomyces sp. NPDC059650 TaxID=3346896 RepID=UPI0036C373E2